jgi:hypothetical protein
MNMYQFDTYQFWLNIGNSLNIMRPYIDYENDVNLIKKNYYVKLNSEIEEANKIIAILELEISELEEKTKILINTNLEKTFSKKMNNNTYNFMLRNTSNIAKCILTFEEEKCKFNKLTIANLFEQKQYQYELILKLHTLASNIF